MLHQVGKKSITITFASVPSFDHSDAPHDGDEYDFKIKIEEEAASIFDRTSISYHEDAEGRGQQDGKL